MKSVALNSEELTRKKSMKISVILHTTVLLLALIPFLNNNPLNDITKGEIIMAIDFSHSSSSARNKTAAESGAQKQVEEVKKQEEVVEENVETEEAEVLPEEQAEPIVSETEENNEPVKAAEEETQESDENLEQEIEESSEESPETEEDSSVSESNETDGNGKSDSGDNSGASDLGKEDEGEYGANGEGEEGFDDSGDGIFGRQVIKHAKLNEIMKKTGRIAVKVCINQAGRVKEVSLIKEESTIKDRDILQAALEATTEYLFETDIEAPAMQCGKLTFVLEIERDDSFFSFFE